MFCMLLHKSQNNTGQGTYPLLKNLGNVTYDNNKVSYSGSVYKLTLTKRINIYLFVQVVFISFPLPGQRRVLPVLV